MHTILNVQSAYFHDKKVANVTQMIIAAKKICKYRARHMHFVRKITSKKFIDTNFIIN